MSTATERFFPKPAYGTRMQRKRDISRATGQRLAELRKAHGLTQVQLGLKLGISQPVLASYETGRRNFPLAVLTACAEALEISVGDLLGQPARPGKRGPRSKLELQFERLRTLPKAEQELAAQLLDRLLAAAK